MFNVFVFETIHRFLLSSFYETFAELGRLCRYEPRCGYLFSILQRSASDLLVWDSADKSGKGQLLIRNVAQR
jgi:hypothetical protein